MSLPGAVPAALEPLATTDPVDGAAPELFVDPEGRRFAKTLFDEASDANDEPGPISAEAVQELERHYLNAL
jgi:hypothetical protein